MIFREPMAWAIEVFAIVAFEGKVDLDPAPLAIQTVRLPETWGYLVTPYF